MSEKRIEKILGAVDYLIALVIVAAALCVGVNAIHISGEAIKTGLSVVGAAVVTVWLMRWVLWLDTGRWPK